MDKYFFELPVFRCSLNKWGEEQAAEKDKQVAYFESFAPGSDKKTYQELADKTIARSFSSYRYTELIGMVRLFILGDQVRAELWFIKNRIGKKIYKKRWHLASLKLFERSIHNSYSNKEIYELICEALKKEAKEHLLKNRFIDLECFENTGPLINYRLLISS